MNVRMWAARWKNLDVLQVFLTSTQGITANLDMGRGTAKQLVRDLTRTEQERDDTHEIVTDRTQAPIVLERDDAIGLRNALVSLLDRGLLASPPAGIFKQELRLGMGSTVQIMTPGVRWV